MIVNVLGSNYELTIKKYDEDEAFDRLHIDGYCDGSTKKIVVYDMSTYKGWENESVDTATATTKETIRHEIVHAFLNESGLCSSGLQYEGSWARNEEMVDWVALQGPKIYKAWQEAGAL